MTSATIIRLEFTVSNLVHSALVSVCGDDERRFIHVQLLHSFFKKVFGVEHIRFRNADGELLIEDACYPFVRQIADAISSQINKKLNTENLNPQLRII